MKLGTTLALVAALALSAAPPANAEKARTPAQGDPALEIEVPGGWKSSVTKGGTLAVESASQRSRIWLQVLSDPRLANTPLEQIAAGFYKNIGAGQYSRVEPESIGGRPGETYGAAVSDNGGFQVAVFVTLVRLGPQHVAFLAHGSTQDTRGAQLIRTWKGVPTQTHYGGEGRTMNIIIDEIRIVGLK
jgi:hypothetical protein